MNDLPRSRALVRLDGPGHIMPVDPVTPPDSRVLRVVHLPLILAGLGMGMLFAASVTLNVLGIGLQTFLSVPGARLATPLIGAASIVGFYYAYVRLVERRPRLEELSGAGWWQELGAGFAGGALLALAAFVILIATGSAYVIGVNPVRPLIFSVVAQFCTAIVAEIILCGIGFRLVERLLGSWGALLLGMIAMTVAGFVANQDLDNATTAAVGAAFEGALLFAAPFMLTRRLWAAIGLDAAHRIAQVALYGTAMSPIGPRGLLVTLVTGPEWLTGGGAGVTSSLITIAVNALAVLAMLVLAVRWGRIVRPAWRRGRIV